MKLSSWVWAAGGIACLVVAYLVVAPVARDEMLQFARAWQERNDGADLAHRLVSPDSLLDYIAQHPEQAALASWEVGREHEGIYFNAYRPQPDVTGTALIALDVIADDLANRGHELPLVELDRWERYYLPGTDGGTHQAALHEARTYGTLVEWDAAVEDAESVGAGGVSAAAGNAAEPSSARYAARLTDVVRAMVRYGDPAATDLLLDRIGRARLTEHVRALGFAADTMPLPMAGMQLSFLTDAPGAELLARYRVMKRAQYEDTAWERLSRLRDDAAYRSAMVERIERTGSKLSLREAAQLNATLLPRGTARGYARLMQQIVSGQDSRSEYMRTQLDWPVSGVGTREAFEAYGAVSGSQPGVYMSVTYGRPKGATGTRVLALMLQKLPLGVWLHLSPSLVVRRFEAELLADESFFVRARELLASGHARASASRDGQRPILGQR